jgi:hypothetical protein
MPSAPIRSVQPASVFTALGVLLAPTISPAQGVANACAAQSAPTLTPVVELYTSEGCSSCPPADRWLSTLKRANAEGKVVAQAFHVNYWDYIGWKDRFAAPAYTARQREISARTGLNGIYTPQLVRDGVTSRDYQLPRGGPAAPPPAKATILLKASAPSHFEAKVTPTDPNTAWAAYATVTEHQHISRVTAGENRGETLHNDFVVRQLVPLGQYSGAQSLRFATLAADAAHPRQINLVVTDRQGRTLQALSLACG